MEFYRLVLGVASVLMVCTDAYERVDVRKRVDEIRQSRSLNHGKILRKRSVELEEDEEINQRDLLLLEPGEDLQQVTSEQSSVGVRVIKYQETYQSIPVFDGIVTVETSQDGKLTGDASGTLIQKISEDIHDSQPSLTKDEILERAIEIEGDDRSEIGEIKVELWIYPDENSKARLVYFVQYLIERNVTKRPSMILDSSTAEVILRYDALETASTAFNRINLSSNSLCKSHSITGLGGNQKIGKIEYGKEPFCIQPEKECLLQNSHVRVVNMMNLKNETVDTLDSVSFLCSKYPDDEEKGAYSPALDAYFYGTIVSKMYSEWIGGSPLEDKVILRVHYGTDYENAFWNGKNVTFGDGAYAMYPLVSLDIVGHEIGHGVVERHSNLMYLRQSGGINEAFADIMGETAVAYFSTDALDWKIGAEISKAMPFLRSFDNPEADGGSISHVSNFTPAVLPHFSSGIFRFAFYTLVAKQNVSIKHAFRAFDRANKLYWHHMSTFQDAGCLVIKAAYDLGQDVNAYRKAFDAVGIVNCKLEAHILGLVNGKEYPDILVSNDSTPLFKYTTPLWVANVTVLAKSNESDIDILLSNTSTTEEPFAVGENSIQFSYDGGKIVYIRLSNAENVEQNVTLMVTYECNLSWVPKLKQTKMQVIWDYCVFLYDCDREKYFKLPECNNE